MGYSCYCRGWDFACPKKVAKGEKAISLRLLEAWVQIDIYTAIRFPYNPYRGDLKKGTSKIGIQHEHPHYDNGLFSKARLEG
jgi:hypothetical protein